MTVNSTKPPAVAGRVERGVRPALVGLRHAWPRTGLDCCGYHDPDAPPPPPSAAELEAAGQLRLPIE